MEAPIIAALVTGSVSLVTSGLVSLWVAQRRGVVDKDLATMKAQLENRTLFQAERVAHELLMMPEWELRSFDAIKRRLGGFEDEQIRQILIRAGALKFEGKGGEEMWGLLERNRHRLH
jgi:hypothetical protein